LLRHNNALGAGRDKRSASWRDWVSTVGPYQRVQILITTPTGSLISPFIQLNFEKATQDVRDAYRERGPVSFSQGGILARSTLLVVPIGRDEFSYFGFRSGKNVVITFPTKEDGSVSDLAFHSPKAALRVPADKR
jgi:hypothetical protein